MQLLITKIQRFSLYDGPGIRTTVFLKGCTIKCPWCANPENINIKPELYFEEKLCIYTSNKIDKCLNVCPISEYIKNNKKLEIREEIYKSNNECPVNAVGTYGQFIEQEYLLKEILKDKSFYKNGGGVTFSGGEPLIYYKELLDICNKLKKNNINICMETALFVPEENLISIIDYIDLFIVDIKILDQYECKIYLNGNIDMYLNNIKILINLNKNILFRLPLVKPFTFNKKNIDSIKRFLSTNRVKNVEVFKVHNLGIEKYHSLGIYNCMEFDNITDEEINNVKKEFEELNINVKILSI